MSITVKIGNAQDVDTKVALKLRKSLNGDFMIFDHEDIDIIVSPTKGKVIILPKDMLDDKVYAAQNRLMKHLTKKGLIDQESIKSGNIYGSLSSNILEPADDVNSTDLTLLNIGRWIDQERPHFMASKSYEEKEVERLVDPEDDESTELGEIPQADRKGSVNPGMAPIGAQRPYLSETKKK